MKIPFQDATALRDYCTPFLRGELKPATAAQLMASRYVAYTLGDVDYLMATTDPAQIEELDRESIRDWSSSAEWLGLEILESVRGGPEDEEGEVEFIARFAIEGERASHHERSTFRRLEGDWVFVEGHVKSS